jgi:hypothetical protein
MPTRAAPSVPHELSARPSAAGPDATFTWQCVCGGVCARARVCVCLFMARPLACELLVVASEAGLGLRRFAGSCRVSADSERDWAVRVWACQVGRREVVRSKNDPEKVNNGERSEPGGSVALCVQDLRASCRRSCNDRRRAETCAGIAAAIERSSDGRVPRNWRKGEHRDRCTPFAPPFASPDAPFPSLPSNAARHATVSSRWRSRADDGACRLRRPCSCAHVHTDHSVNDVF